MTYKNLFLDRDRIENAVKTFNNSANTLNMKSKPQDHYVMTVQHNGQQAVLDLYYNADDITTLVPSRTGNKQLSLDIVKHIKSICQYSDVSSNSLYIDMISDDDYKIFVEYLAENGITPSCR
jgi:hypothetical protein